MHHAQARVCTQAHPRRRSGRRPRASVAQGRPSPLEWGPGLGSQALGGAAGRAPAAQTLGEGQAIQIRSVEPLTTSTLMPAQQTFVRHLGP